MPANNSRNTIFRQWRLLQFLPREPQATTVSDIHRRLAEDGYSVTRRTVERDLNQLMAAGFPLVVDDSQEPYLWSWRRGFPVLMLPVPTVSDALLLSMVRDYLSPILPSGMLQALAPFLANADDVLKKSLSKSSLARWRQKVRVAHPWQSLLPPKVDESARDVVSKCLIDETQVLVRYSSRSQHKTTDLQLHPHALLQRGQMIYLLATNGDYDDIRWYALNRIQSATNTYHPIRALPDFDLDTYLASGHADFGTGGTLVLNLLVAPDVAEHLMECRLSKDQHLQPVNEPEGWFQVRATVKDTPQLVWWLRGFGDSVQRLPD